MEEPLYVEDDLWNLLSDVEKEESPGPWTEFYQLSGLVSRFLLKYNRCIFHGVAFLWKDQAWIITAPSGTGKTTQICLWQKLFGREIEIMVLCQEKVQIKHAFFKVGLPCQSFCFFV